MNLPNRYLLDTDILIEYIRGQEPAMTYVDELDGELLVSAATVAELFVGTRNEDEQQQLDVFLSAMLLIPVDQAIAKQGGLYRRQYGKSHGTGLIDALIAATAEATGASLVSFNRRHFPMVADLQIPYER
jgi:predicted nucleic acid-binding protein